MKYLHILAAVAATLGLSGVARADAPATYYFGAPNVGGPNVYGEASGTHSYDLGGGTFATSTITPGSDPRIVLQASVSAANPAGLVFGATLTFSASIKAKDNNPGAAQFTPPATIDSGTVVAHADGYVQLSGVLGSSLSVSLGSLGGGTHFFGCDDTFCYSPTGQIPSGTLVPYRVDLTAGDFNDCFSTSCYATPNSGPMGHLTLYAQAIVAPRDDQGNDASGSIYAMIDPTITLDRDFATANGIDPDAYTVEVAEITPAPEPGEWAMMAAGLGIVGGAVRRRRKAAA